jgi:hypothetical protein
MDSRQRQSPVERGSADKGESMMRQRATICLLAGLLALGADRAAASTILTFEDLQNYEPVANYYNGGLGGLGSGPGPAYGVTFSPYALAYIPGMATGKVTPYPGDPSPPTVLLLANLSSPFGAGYPTSFTMDSQGGFSGLYFYDINIAMVATSVQVYSGLDGTGNQLANLALPATTQAFGGPTEVPFSGLAHSAVFSGGNDQLALDNITLVAAPNPSSVVLLALGLGSVYCISRRRHRASTCPPCAP